MKTRGFVTIATGEERFFSLADNLLISYRKNTIEPLPFAIICDKENDITRKFDVVVKVVHAYCSYLDKIELLNNLPFDETIFIDADSLVYGNINIFFHYFPFCGVRHFGSSFPVNSVGKGWFDAKDVGEWKNRLHFCIYSYGGIIFLNRDKLTQKIYTTCNYIKDHYSEYSFREFELPADEPIMALAMAIHNCPPIDDQWLGKTCYYRVEKNITKADIEKGYFSYISKWNHNEYRDIPLVHFGTQETGGWLYKSEVVRLKGNPFYSIYKALYHLMDWCKESKYKLKSTLYNCIVHRNC